MASDYLFPSIHGTGGLLTLDGDDVLAVSMLGKLVALDGHALDLADLAEGEYGTLFLTGPGTVTGGVAAVLGADDLLFVAVNGAEFDFLLTSGSAVATADLVTEPGAGSAAAGKLGEYVASLVPMGVGAAALVNATPANITSIPLTAGNWDVEANVIFFGLGTTPVSRAASISITSASIHEDGLQGYNSSPADGVESIALTRKRISLAAPATVYLVAQAYFAGGSMDGAGAITARRVH